MHNQEENYFRAHEKNTSYHLLFVSIFVLSNNPIDKTPYHSSVQTIIETIHKRTLNNNYCKFLTKYQTE